MDIKLYIDEIIYQINAAHQALSGSGDLFINHHRFLVHCAIIHKILFPSEHYLQDDEKVCAIDREKKLHDYFVDCKDFKNSSNINRFRNHFEHLDTRLDKYVNRENKVYVDRNISNVPLNKIIGGISDADLFRNFECGKLTFMGETFDTDEAQKWINSIEKYIGSGKYLASENRPK